MDEQQTPEHVPKLGEKYKKPGRKAKIFLNILLVILLLAVIGLVFLNTQADKKLASRDREISSLKERISLLDTPPVEAPAEGAAEVCTGGSSYTADIGKFSIELDDPRVIIRDLDAGFEGGPITKLEIGSCLADESNVVDTPPQTEVNILGHPASSSADLRTAYESRAGAPLTAAGTMTIDGVSANKYTGDGLFAPTLVYFDNAGIGYEIELVDTNDTTNAILADLSDDWSFTP